MRLKYYVETENHECINAETLEDAKRIFSELINSRGDDFAYIYSKDGKEVYQCNVIEDNGVRRLFETEDISCEYEMRM